MKEKIYIFGHTFNFYNFIKISDDGRTKPKPRASKLITNPPAPVSEYKCLIRATLGKSKISTVVSIFYYVCITNVTYFLTS